MERLKRDGTRMHTSDRRGLKERGEEAPTLQAWSATLLDDMTYLAAETAEEARTLLLALSELAEAKQELVDEALRNIHRRFAESAQARREGTPEPEYYPISTPPRPTRAASRTPASFETSPPRGGVRQGTDSEANTGTE